MVLAAHPELIFAADVERVAIDRRIAEGVAVTPHGLLGADQVMSRVKLAEVAAQAGQTEDALREFSRAADQLDAQGRTDDWLRVAEKLIALQPESYNLAKKAASRYLERQNPKAALARLQPCFEALPRDLETLQLLATTFEQLGQGGKAISVLKELVKVHEDHRQRAERNAAIHRILAIDPGPTPSRDR